MFFSYVNAFSFSIHLHRCWTREWKRSKIVSRISHECIRKSVRISVCLQTSNNSIWELLWGVQGAKGTTTTTAVIMFLKRNSHIMVKWWWIFQFHFLLISFQWEFFIYINIIIAILTLIRDAHRDILWKKITVHRWIWGKQCTRYGGRQGSTGLSG